MREDHNTILRHVYIRLYGMCSRCGRALESTHSILWVLRLEPTMGDGLG